MNKPRKVLLVLICVLLVMAAVLVGCGSDGQGTPVPDGKAEYSIYVTGMGGMGLHDVTVTATKDGEKIASGATDYNGLFAFTADKGVYDIEVGELPPGYELTENNSYKTSATKFKLVILASSSVILDEIPETKVYKVGDVIYDFSITDPTDRISNVTYTLSEVLSGKRMVLLNFWNTNCNPCMSEMPELELAYRQYIDDVAIFGINVPLLGVNRISDVRETRAKVYTDAEGNQFSLSFPLAIDDNKMPYHFALTSIPVSVVIDRYGVIALIHTGSMDKSMFAAMFAKYTSDDYVQDNVGGGNDDPSGGEELVREKPNVSQPDSAEIERAINGAGFTGSYYPETEAADAEYSWPWLVGETGGEKYIHPANHEKNYSFATIYTKVTISATDVQSSTGKVVLVFDLQWSCENLYDYFYVIINNSLVYEYTGTEQWGSWQPCYALVADEPGDYTLCMLYVKDEQTSEGADTVRIKNMRLLSVAEIDIPSLDMPREAAREWNGAGYNRYATVVPDEDGFYHKDSVSGPYIVADLMNPTLFNGRLTTTWSVAQFAINGYFDYNTVDPDEPGYNPLLDDTDGITKWAMAANNSELNGLTLVNDELIGLLNKFIKTQVNSFNDKIWLEFCKYFDHYGTDESDKGICDFERNPIRGLLNETAIPTVAAHDGAFPDLKNIDEQYKNKVVLTRLIVPRGFKYVFTPTKSGVYRFRSQSRELADTMAWLMTYDAAAEDYLVTTDSQLENADEEYNFVITYYLEANVPYIFATCFADMGVTGEFTFTTEYLGEELYVWQYASRNYFTTANDEMTDIVNYANVMPVLVGNTYYNAKKDANGEYVTDGNGNFVANTDDPIYVDFVTGARFFDAGSLELCFTYSDKARIVNTLSSILSIVFRKNKPSAGWAENTALESIKGGALTDDDWSDIITRLYVVYGDNVYIDDPYVIAELVECSTIGDVADLLKKYYLSFFDQRYWIYDESYGIDPSRYKDYTILVQWYYDQAVANTGNPDRGYADRGCVILTEELRDALDMFCKRIGGFPELDTDWLRLCAHYEYIGPYKG